MKNLILIALLSLLSYNSDAQKSDMAEATVLSMNKADLVNRFAEFTINTGPQSWNDFKASYGLSNSTNLRVPNATLVSGFKPDKDLQFKKLKLRDSNGNSLSLIDARIIGLKESGSTTIWHLKYKTVK